ncbi:DEMETER-like protein, partial [Trifolium pratense]
SSNRQTFEDAERPQTAIDGLHEGTKVDLDEGTNKVWKLLMLDINSHRVDGTDEVRANGRKMNKIFSEDEQTRLLHGCILFKDTNVFSLKMSQTIFPILHSCPLLLDFP